MPTFCSGRRATAVAQETGTLSDVLSESVEAGELLREQGQHDRAASSPESARERYLAADPEEQFATARTFESLLCELARTYALLDRPGLAVERRQEYFDLAYASYSTTYREVGYYYLSHHHDFDRIRSAPESKTAETPTCTTTWRRASSGSRFRFSACRPTR